MRIWDTSWKSLWQMHVHMQSSYLFMYHVYWCYQYIYLKIEYNLFVFVIFGLDNGLLP